MTGECSGWYLGIAFGQVFVAGVLQKTYLCREGRTNRPSRMLYNYIDLKDIKLKTLPKTIYVFSKEQQQTLENKLKEKMNIRKLCLLLCLYTGLRIGEICGLKWENINFNTNSLEIKRTIQRIKDTSSTNSKTKLIESTPKSLTSNRIVSIPAFIMEYLKKFKSNDDYYILSNSNKLYDPRQFEEFYKRILKKCNINLLQ